MADWKSFVNLGDEWLISYAIPPMHSVSVKLFTIGHALELYLKAVIAKRTGSVDGLVLYGHNIKKMWDECKGIDPNFMHDYEIRDSMIDALSRRTDTPLNPSDELDLAMNGDLYLVFCGLADWKYFGTVHKSPRMPRNLATAFPNVYWIHFFKALRSYLGHASAREHDEIRAQIDLFRRLPDEAVRFLQQMYS
jgi:hypothetical protein